MRRLVSVLGYLREKWLESADAQEHLAVLVEVGQLRVLGVVRQNAIDDAAPQRAGGDARLGDAHLAVLDVYVVAEVERAIRGQPAVIAVRGLGVELRRNL